MKETMIRCPKCDEELLTNGSYLFVAGKVDEHLVAVRMEIQRLESGLDLGEIKKIREKARAWEIVFKEAREVAALRGISSQKNTLIARLQEILAQAQAELVLKDEGLEAEGKEKGDSHE